MLVASHELDVNSGSEQVYNALDACLTHEIFGTLQQQIPQAVPAYSFELALQAPVLEMMLRGFRVDPAARELGIQTVKGELARLEYIIMELASAILDRKVSKRNPKGKLILPGSSLQLKELFYENLGITPIKVWEKGELKFPMNREVIEQIEDYFQARPIAAAILSHRDKTKELQVLETEVDEDWRMRTSYNIGGTKSARFSSSKSPTGSGTNLQNITEELRHILTADPGYVLCGIDAEQSDSRMVGYMCGLLFDDWTYLDACESGDLHTYVARMTWPNDLPWNGDLKKDRKIAEAIYYRHFSYRDCTKKLGHGTNFLGKAPTLSRLIHIPKSLIIPFQEKYFDAFPAIPKWQAWTASELQSKQQLTSIHGRKRDFFDRTNADETVRKGLAFLAASATADNLNLGMWKIWRFMPEVQVLAQVHDAVYFQFKETEDRKAIVAKAQELLKLPLTAPNGRIFTVPTEVKLGYNWGNYVPPDLKEGKPERNPRGLRKL
jgi:DNA polymerase I-like protein with 3'-5' exonuclease and polymerase domains